MPAADPARPAAPALPPSRKSRAVLAACLGVAAALGGGCGGCAPDAPPLDVRALQANERDAAAGTRYTRQRALPDGEYYYDARRPDDARNYDPDTLVRRELAAGTNVDLGENLPIDAAALAASTRPASRPSDPSGASGAAGLVGPATQPSDARIVALPLQECVRRATLNNFDVAVAAYDPAIAETRVTEALARFDPTFQATSEYQRQNTVDPAQGFLGNTKRFNSTAAITQLLPSGSQLQLQYQALYQDFQNPLGLGTPNPSWTSGLTLQFTQPLLRDFGFDTNRARIFINANDQRVSILDFRDKLEEALLQVEQTYWQLYEAQEQVKIQEELLRRTLDTTQRIQVRQAADTDRSQLTQSLAEVYTRRADLLQAKGQVAQLSDQLLRLINDPDLPVAGGVVVSASTPPVDAPLLFDFKDALDTALASRPELSQQLLRIDSAGSAARVAKSNLLPRLDAVLSGGVQGIGGGFGSAVDDQFGGDAASYGLGLQLEIPLGNRAARGIQRRAILQRMQAVTQYQGLIKQVTLEVSQAQRQVTITYARLGQLREARLAARDVVEQVTNEEESGAPLDAGFIDRKLRVLSTLLSARSQEARALSDYQQSIAQYERAKGTLLRYNNIVLQEAARDLSLPAGRGGDVGAAMK